MQIDFHHAVTYVAARCAGFSHAEADVVAYAAQYVDDATSSGVVCFDNRAMYSRISSAHKMLDPLNLSDPENHLTWLPFHFLPGNGQVAAGSNPEGTFIEKIVCRPDSPIAQEMVALALTDSGKPFGLHRLGIAMHVYADTWAHQGFAGVLHHVNDVDDAHDVGGSGVFGVLSGFLSDILDDSVPPIGHGRAGVLPDMPFLIWEYRNGMGQVVHRDNPTDYMSAAQALCRAMQRYRKVTPNGLSAEDAALIRHLITSVKDQDGDKRHAVWLDAIANGVSAGGSRTAFSWGKATLSYADDGHNSWKAQALGTSIDMPVHPYKQDFLSSNWKLFHDALQAHRLAVLHDILPKYGICAA
ncbi:MAG: DUF6765 family protein [Pseudomonadota bacterium]